MPVYGSVPPAQARWFVVHVEHTAGLRGPDAENPRGHRDGLADGAWARVETATGAVVAKVSVQTTMQPGHVRVPHGWWYPETRGTIELAGAFVSSDAVLCSDDDEFLDAEQGTPHFKADGVTLNKGSMKAFITSAIAKKCFSDGKTTTTRLISHVLATSGLCVGMTNTDGVYVGGRQTDSGDCSGPKSARSILAYPLCDAAALETARGGILREGLAFDH